MTTSRASDIDVVLRLSTEYGFPVIVSGGEEAWRRADILADRGVPVIVKPQANSPVQFDRLGTRFDNAALLSDAGVSVIISSFETHKASTLRREAGHAVRYGMDWDKALAAITLLPAQALQIDGSRGSIETGKVANIVVWSGDPFQFSSRAEHVFIRGHEMTVDSRQKRLLERYRTLDATAPQFKANRN
jgi:imidazolonepropionase-like amidohydrolase